MHFELHKGVKFHDGTPFSADALVFSFVRINQPPDSMSIYVAGIAAIKKIDGHGVRTIFIAMNQFSLELKNSDVKSKNRLKDKRVRKALNLAVAHETIKRGLSIPAAIMIAPGVQWPHAGHRRTVDGRSRQSARSAGRRRPPERLRVHAELPQPPLRQR